MFIEVIIMKNYLVFDANQGIINSFILLNDGTICVSSNNDGITLIGASIKIFSIE